MLSTSIRLKNAAALPPPVASRRSPLRSWMAIYDPLMSRWPSGSRLVCNEGPKSETLDVLVHIFVLETDFSFLGPNLATLFRLITGSLFLLLEKTIVEGSEQLLPGLSGSLAASTLAASVCKQEPRRKSSLGRGIVFPQSKLGAGRCW